MNFSKKEMQEELFKFMRQFARDIESLYGISNSPLTVQVTIEQSRVWTAASEMYDYGVLGIPNMHLYPGARFYGIYAQTETFLKGIANPAMKIFMSESSNTAPSLAITTAQTAVARIILDGGDRHTDYEQGEYGLRNSNFSYLTLAEIALLANMDERSVRNAANPKVADPLKTEQFGKRSLVSPEEARRWLAGRKAYIPTQKYEGPYAPRPPEYNIEFTEDQVKIIEEIQKNTGMTLQEIIENLYSNFLDETKSKEKSKDKGAEK